MKISAFFQHMVLISIDTILTINSDSFPVEYPHIWSSNVFSILLTYHLIPLHHFSKSTLFKDFSTPSEPLLRTLPIAIGIIALT